MRKMLMLAAATVSLISGVASAQDTSFRGFRVEANAGGDRFQSQGKHNDRFGYGATIGFDGLIGDKIVVGPEASYWRANKWTDNSTVIGGGVLDHKSFQEYGAAVRAGYLIQPRLLVFGKAGYVNNEQRKRYTTPIAGRSYYNHFSSDGYQVGGGVEYTITDSTLPVYVNAQYVYSQYSDNTSRQRVMAGIGIRFK